MKCQVCGNESGKYPLCRACNLKKEKGEIIKCEKCGNWHKIASPCVIKKLPSDSEFLYNPKSRLISKSEEAFFIAIKESLPDGFLTFAQINLASFIERTDNSRFHNELFRNVDYLITDLNYSPKAVIEINDSTHTNYERKERDKKVQDICEEAGIPIIRFWTSYGVNKDYIKTKITEALTQDTGKRVHHFSSVEKENPVINDPVDTVDFETTNIEIIETDNSKKRKKGCYIATCVYGSYDCAPVWVLRRYRDKVLSSNFFGRFFIFLYYLFSPTAVRFFGSKKWFVKPIKKCLDYFVVKLEEKGFSNEPYIDS